MEKASPCQIDVLTNNGTELTDRLFNREKHASGEHEFDKLCKMLGIEHRLSPPSPPTSRWNRLNVSMATSKKNLAPIQNSH